MSLPSVLEGVRRRPGRYLRDVTLDIAIAFVSGCDEALLGNLLAGFREWLVMRLGHGNNLAWSGLVPELLKDRSTAPSEVQVEGLFELLDEFFAEREKHDGLRKIYLQYEKWLRAQEWYREP